MLVQRSQEVIENTEPQTFFAKAGSHVALISRWNTWPVLSTYLRYFGQYGQNLRENYKINIFWGKTAWDMGNQTIFHVVGRIAPVSFTRGNPECSPHSPLWGTL